MISDEAYRSSTQYRNFSFPSKEKLRAQRAKANADAASRLPPGTSYLTVEEEVELVDHYVTKLWELSHRFRAPSSLRVPPSHPPCALLTSPRQPQRVFSYVITSTILH
jgi:hypothetical protein